MEREQLALPRRPPARIDLVAWVAGIAVLGLTGMSLFRKVVSWAGWELPGGTTAFLSEFSWWLYWGSVVVLGIVVMRRWRTSAGAPFP